MRACRMTTLISLNPKPNTPHAILWTGFERIVVHPNRIEMVCRKTGSTKPRYITNAISIPWTKPSQTRRREILQARIWRRRDPSMGSVRAVRLLRAIAMARLWLNELITGVIPDIGALAARERKSERSVRMTLSLAFLDPALVKAAAQGRLPRGLWRVPPRRSSPLNFEDQWRALGLVRPT